MTGIWYVYTAQLLFTENIYFAIENQILTFP